MDFAQRAHFAIFSVLPQGKILSFHVGSKKNVGLYILQLSRNDKYNAPTLRLSGDFRLWRKRTHGNVSARDVDGVRFAYST